MARIPLLEIASRDPERMAVVDPAGSYCYRQVLDHAQRLAASLRDQCGEAADAHDLGQQRVAFLVTPGFHYVVAQWGIWQAGGVCVPLGLKHPQPELEYVLDDAQVSAIVADRLSQPRVAELAQHRSLPLVVVDALAGAADDGPTDALDASRRAMILYTSGSTGLPKGVVTTHANILAQVDALVEAWHWRAEDRILNVLPMHHIHGIINVLGCAVRVGACCEFLPAFDARAVWQRLASGELTLFMAVPTVYAKLIAEFDGAKPSIQQAWSAGARKVRLMVSGSAALPVPTLERWQQITGHRLLERYGMTEIGMALSNPYDGHRRAGFVGSPLPRVEVQRRSESGDPVDDATPGEIEVRGPAVFQEYWQRAEATRTSFRDGWFRTGDVAVVDDGAYRILGRNSVDIIKTGGYKVSALEIEDVLRSHPAIHDCAVVGVPDDQWGERVAVCIACPDGTDLALDALREWGKQRMAAYKVPSLLHVCPALPRNAMGKVQKPRVLKLFEAS